MAAATARAHTHWTSGTTTHATASRGRSGCCSSSLGLLGRQIARGSRDKQRRIGANVDCRPAARRRLRQRARRAVSPAARRSRKDVSCDALLSFAPSGCTSSGWCSTQRQRRAPKQSRELPLAPGAGQQVFAANDHVDRVRRIIDGDGRTDTSTGRCRSRASTSPHCSAGCCVERAQAQIVEGLRVVGEANAARERFGRRDHRRRDRCPDSAAPRPGAVRRDAAAMSRRVHRRRTRVRARRARRVRAR